MSTLTRETVCHEIFQGLILRSVDFFCILRGLISVCDIERLVLGLSTNLWDFREVTYII